MKQYKVIAFDLDGTLTQHRTPLGEANAALLRALGQKYRCLMVGAGSCERIFRQMNGFPIEIIGNYGMQHSVMENGELRLIKSDRYETDREFFERAAERVRRQTGYTDFRGESVQFHESGAVTFPLLGTDADLRDKLRFDPTGEKRRAIYDFVAAAFADYNCFVGGSSSFDIVRKPYDKYTALTEFAAQAGIRKEEILFTGDDFGKGGNDEAVMRGGIDCVVVNDYRAVGDRLAEAGISVSR